MKEIIHIKAYRSGLDAIQYFANNASKPFCYLRSALSRFLFILITGIWFFSCQDPYEGSTFTAFEELPASSYLASRPDDFSLWIELLKHTDLYNTLNLNTSYTLFAPNNHAMTQYLESKGVTSVSQLEVEESVYLVKYHILYGKALESTEFKTGAIDWPTVTDDQLSITFKDGGLIYINNSSQIIETDIEVTNGIIHTLNKVLIPITATLYDRINNNRYSILKQAIDATGFDDLLNKVSEEGLDGDGQPIVKRYFYTLFAISDSIFQQENIHSLDDLIDSLHVSGTEYTNPGNLLYQYVAYHILAQLKSTANLAIQSNEASENINTLASRELINLSASETNQIRINYDPVSDMFVRILFSDIACKNGVIHEVDSWMPVKTPPATEVLWDLADDAELASVCNYFQSPFPNGGSSTYYKYLSKDEISTYVWESVPAEKKYVVTYVNSRNNDGVFYAAQNHDHLQLNPGIGGWVEMKSPVVVKATYKITIGYISYFSTSSSGELQCYLDGVKLGTSFFMSNTNQDQIATKVLSSSVTFTETDEHTLRIVGIDGRNLTLDYILFEPIN